MEHRPVAEDGIDSQGVGIVQRGNLRLLESALREYWNLGQNIMLCWCATQQGVELLVAPHYFLGNFSSSLNDSSPVDRLDALNGQFIRQLISGRRQMTREEFSSTARRLDLTPTCVRLPIPLQDDKPALELVEQMVKRYSISHVVNRAVLLFDIVNFSLFTPFEQTSQINSLSYSLNSAYNKLLKKNIAIDFARTTTGDGFYVWNRDTSAKATIELFQFMLLVVADNAIAKRKSKGNTVPVLRTGFHLGNHYEFYQVEGINPTMYSYIVGDVTIELARMLDIAESGQILIGDFKTQVPTSQREGAYLVDVDAQQFIERISKHLETLRGLELSGEKIDSMHCYLTGETGASAGRSVRRFRITDKHGRSRNAYNLRINIHTRGGKPLILGMQDYYLPRHDSYRARRDQKPAAKPAGAAWRGFRRTAAED